MTTQAQKSTAKPKSTQVGGTSVTMPAPRQIRTERDVGAPRDRVWRAFTDPVQLAQWWCRGNKLVVECMDVERGGLWRFVEHTPEGLKASRGDTARSRRKTVSSTRSSGTACRASRAWRQ